MRSILAQPRGWALAAALAIVALSSAPVHAQSGGGPTGQAARQGTGQGRPIDLTVQRDDIGLLGTWRLGTWTPMRLTLVNTTGRPIAIRCRWLLKDFDGDRVHARRLTTIDSGSQPQHVWLYAPPPTNYEQDVTWTVQVLDEAGTQLLADPVDVVPPANGRLTDHESAIGVIGSASLGLSPYTERTTRHEAVRLVRGLRLTELPDRWYGLAALDALIWTPDGSAPTAPEMSDAEKRALRQWVRRGGHLVIVLPSAGERWTHDPLLAEMLPVRTTDVERAENALLPEALYERRPQQRQIDLVWFDVDEDDDNAPAVLLRDEQDRPFVVAKRHHFGRVTMIGADLTAPNIRGQGLPAGRFPMWNKVFHWQSPVFSQQYIESEMNSNPPKMTQVRMRDSVGLGTFVPSMLSQRNTAAPALLWAVLAFLLYWVLAGPVAFVVLRQKDWLRHSWLVFIALVLVFSLATWGGAWLMRPQRAYLDHFTVLTMQANDNDVHAHSWLSLYTPRFGDVRMTLGAEDNDTGNTLASPGLPGAGQGAGFLDPRTYELDVAGPRALDVPLRGTAKQFELDYFGSLDDDEQPGLTAPWGMPQGRVRVENAFPVGRLTHNLPGPLRDVRFVYCPGDGEVPWIWLRDRWPAREVLDLSENTQQRWRLVRRPRKTDDADQYADDRNWINEGFLGMLIDRKTGRSAAVQGPSPMNIADNVKVQSLDMLGFYAMLPPPNFRKMPGIREKPAPMYTRPLGRRLDLSHLTAERRLIVIGYLRDAPLPAPLTVDGEPIPSNGWTVVRWVYDL